MVGIQEIAKRAGVSISTVSRVVNGTKPVSDSLRDKVQKAIDEFDYRPDDMAGGMKRQRTRNIGVVLPSLQMLYFPEVLRGIEATVEARGYKLMYFSTHYDFALEKEYVRNLKASWVDGIILDSCCPSDELGDYLKVLEAKGPRRNVPVVTLEYRFPSKFLGSVTIDNRRYAMLAARHLTDLGHRRIAMLTGPEELTICVDNVQGYFDALRGADVPIDETLVVPCDYMPSGGYRETKRLLESGTQFTAIFAANDAMAIGAMKALKERGMRIPEDVAVIGFDNTFVGTLLEPSLSSVDVPLYEVGLKASELLLDLIEGKASRRMHIELECRVVTRRSTVAEARVEWNLDTWRG